MADGLTPPTFSGSSEEDVQVWIKQFEQFCVFKKLNNDQKLASIGLLLRGQAAVWYHGLPADITADLNSLKEKLVSTYSLSRNALWQKERQLFNSLQGQTESVNEYITIMRASCRDLDVSEAQLVRLICGGLREELRPSHSRKNLQTVDEVTAAATQIESAAPSSRDSKLLAEIKELRAEVANLRNQAVSVAATPSQEAIQRPRSPDETQNKLSPDQVSDNIIPPDTQFQTVDRLLSTAMVRGKRHYKVKWTDQSQTTWEPEENIPDSLKREFHISHTLKGKRRKGRRGKFLSAFRKS